MSQRGRVVLGFLAVCSVIYIVLIATRTTVTSTQNSDQVPPSLYIQNAEVVNYSPLTGFVEWTLQSPDVKYFSAQQLMIAERPSMRVFDHTVANPWELDAGRAAFHRRDEMVRLNQQVRMRQALPNGEYQLIETARIDYYPNDQYAQAIYPVTIESNFGRSRGDQLKIWLAREYLELQGNVETYYEPTR